MKPNKNASTQNADDSVPMPVMMNNSVQSKRNCISEGCNCHNNRMVLVFRAAAMRSHDIKMHFHVINGKCVKKIAQMT